MRALGTLLLALVLSGCGGSGGEAQRTLTVLAAASLTDTFTELAAEFEEQHPGVDVTLVFGSSATLAESTNEGAPGDVLATADARTMTLADSVGIPEQFASNVLQVAVPKDSPIDDVADLADADFVTCVPTAPCGATAARLLEGVARKPVSEEIDVKAVLARVVEGEADAGLVYRTDVASTGGALRGIDVPGADKDPNTYWLAITRGADDPGLASDWMDLVTGPQGFEVLADAGFGPPA